MAIIDKPSNFFTPHIWSGTNSNHTESIGMQPDFVWVKGRSVATDHTLFDAVRGFAVGKSLNSNTTAAEDGSNTTAFGGISGVTSDGFTVTAGSSNADYVNTSGRTYVSWNWKAGTTSIPSGSTTNPSAVSLSTTSGIGIYKITSPASGSYVLKHGLGQTPKLVIVKDLEASQKWMVWVDTFSNLTNDYLQLNDTAAKATYSTCWGTMNTTDCTIAVGGTLDANNDHLVYVFTEITNYSKFGFYVGDALNTGGPFVYTGFRPAWIMIKRTDGADTWTMYDNKRIGYNVDNNPLFANATTTESTDDDLDILSNGFKIRRNSGRINTDGANMVYFAFAENPFVTSTDNGSIPCTAR